MSKSNYREIDVKKQHRMTFGETFSLCVKGVKHRLLRSVLTLAVVVLAVAFFMFLLSESMFLRSTGRGVQEEIRHERRSQFLLTKMFTPATELVTMSRLADALKRADAVQLDEFSRVGGISRDAVDTLAAKAKTEELYLNWLSDIPSGKRTILIRKFYGREAVNYILDDREGFRTRIEPMVDLRVPGKLEGFDAFLDGYADYLKELRAFNTAWNLNVKRANTAMSTSKANAEMSDATWIHTAPAEAVEAWRAAIEQVGFSLTVDDVALMKEQFQVSQESVDVYKALVSKDVREAWAREFQETKPSTPEEKVSKLKDARAAKVLEGRFDKETLVKVGEKAEYEQRILKHERKLASVIAEEGSFLGLSGRQLFLLGISFIVCMVGISNAMLMSITERFREIATMKCLGATDQYILLQFMMEAGMQGFFGGLLGVVIGFIISSLRGVLTFGSHLIAYWPWADLVGCAVASLVAGVFLAILASIQPSWSASRMAPMEAMRVE